MGAVHIKVKLTNAIDEALVSRGMLAPHLLRELEFVMIGRCFLSAIAPKYFIL